MTITLYSINYGNPPPQIEGGVARSFVAGRDDKGILSARYAEMRCPHYLWATHAVDDKDIVGFHGYRKHMVVSPYWDVEHVWKVVDLSKFRAYQEYLALCATEDVNFLASKYDIVTIPPFDCNENLMDHLRFTRSPNDADVLETVMDRYGKFDYTLPYVRDAMYITSGKMFKEWMEFWWSVVRDLEPMTDTDDLTGDGAYRPRDMSYLTQWIWTLWLNSLKGANIKTIPLYICWEAK